MLQILSYEDLMMKTELADQMFQDRARQFVDRLSWDISKDERGREIDQYDNNNALYVVSSDQAGNHRGSMRLAPTVSQCMIADHFADHFSLTTPSSNRSWEATRFCVSPVLPREKLRSVSSDILAKTREFGLTNALESLIGLCFPAMLRVYRRLGWSPTYVERSMQSPELLLVRWDA